MLPDWITSFFQTKRIFVLLALLCVILLSVFFNNNVSRIVSFSFQLSGNLTEIENVPSDLDITEDGADNLLEGEFKSCPNVMRRMVVGHWLKNKDYSKEEMALVDDALRKTLRHSHIPAVLQRKDNRCGKTYFLIYLKVRRGIIN
ncbi:hypothetical protein BgiMline_006772 [Biomphalaria glabrata]